MTRKPSSRKRRTREHVIGDLSVNHVERHALHCGYSVERTAHDYGTDLWIATYDSAGELENGRIRVQLKATDQMRTLSGGRYATLRVSRKDLHHWLLEAEPVILILYEAQADRAFWTYVQAHLGRTPEFDLARAGAEVTVRIPTANVVDQEAMRKFAEFRNRIVAQTKGVVHDG